MTRHSNLGTPGTATLLYPQPRIQAEPYCSLTPLEKVLKEKDAFFFIGVVVEY
jgi:hypothetical protein